jgi:cell division protein FtsB
MTNKEKVLTIIVTLLILWLFTYNCSGEIDGAKRLVQIEKVDSLAFLRQKEKDSLMFLIAQRNKENSELRTANNNLKSRIKDLRSKPIVVEFKDINSSVLFFNRRYLTENKNIQGYVGLTDSTAVRVIEEVLEKDVLKEVVSLQDSLIANQEQYIYNVDKDVEDFSLMLNSAEKEIEERKIYQKIAEDNIKNLQRKNKNSKYYIIGSFVGGLILGTQLVR